MKILILGSEGFIGKHCIDYFKEQGDSVFGCDLLDLKEADYVYFKLSRLTPGFDELFLENQFDVCINAAGSGSVPHSITHPYGDFEANTLDTFRVLESIRMHNPACRYVNISSAAVYGNPQQLPIRESAKMLPLSPYGWHKYYSELICQEYHTLYGLSTCSIRPFSVYGPGLKKQLFWDIYQKTLHSKTLQLFGTGTESRDFIYITDLISCIHQVLVKGAINGEVYNAATGIESTIHYVATNFVKFIDPSIKVEFNGEQRQGDPHNWRADISLIKEFGYRPSVDLEQGLQSYAQWLMAKG